MDDSRGLKDNKRSKVVRNGFWSGLISLNLFINYAFTNRICTSKLSEEMEEEISEEII